MKIDLSKPPPQVKTLEEAQALIEVLWSMFREQSRQIEEQARRIDALEEQLRGNSRNSSRPPSTDQGKVKRRGRDDASSRKAGGQPGHEGRARELLPVEEVTHVQHCHPPTRCGCGGVVSTSRLGWRHQVIDLPEIKPVITEYRLYAGQCEACGRQHEAVLPAGVSPRLTGPRLLAAIGTLSGGYRLSKRQVQGLLADVFGIDLSVGAISQSEAVLAAALAPVAQEAHAHVRQAPVVHADETGHKEKGDGHWMWVAIAGMVSVFMARASRSAEVARELLGDCFAGILVSDRYAAYGWIAPQRRQVCWAHLLRDFTKMAERSGMAGQIGAELVAHTQRMFAYWHRVRDGTLNHDAFACHMLFLQARIEQALRRGSGCGEARTARSCARILKTRHALWTFVHTCDVEPTNNLAERTLRSYVIWRKICFGTQSRRGSLYMERMMTVVGSCKLQGRNVLDFVTQTVRAHYGCAATPSLVTVPAG